MKVEDLPGLNSENRVEMVKIIERRAKAAKNGLSIAQLAQLIRLEINCQGLEISRVLRILESENFIKINCGRITWSQQ